MPNLTIPSQDILFTRQAHDADRAGFHYDIRLVAGDKAYSFATKKDIPKPGKSIILYETSIHSKVYALSKRVVIPKGNYGSGTTTLDFVRKARLEDHGQHYTLNTSNGEKYLLKHVGKYDKDAWLFKNLSPNQELEKKAFELHLYQHDETGRTSWHEPGWKQEGWSKTPVKYYKRKEITKKSSMNKYLTKLSSDLTLAEKSKGEEAKAITDYTDRLKVEQNPELRKATEFALKDEKEHHEKFKEAIEKMAAKKYPKNKYVDRINKVQDLHDAYTKIRPKKKSEKK